MAQYSKRHKPDTEAKCCWVVPRVGCVRTEFLLGRARNVTSKAEGGQKEPAVVDPF